MSNERVDQGGWSVINKRKKVRRMTTFNRYKPNKEVLPRFLVIATNTNKKISEMDDDDNEGTCSSKIGHRCFFAFTTLLKSLGGLVIFSHAEHI